MFSQETHPGNMPIRILQHNIALHFEQKTRISIGEHKENIKSGNVSPALTYDLSTDKIKVPCADLNTKKISMQEMFLSFLWANIYSVFVIYEEAIMRKMIEGTWAWRIICDEPLTKNAVRLFDWSVSLIDAYSQWDHGLPNPEIPTTKQEDIYAGKVNSIFLNAIVYLLLHEYGHLILKHSIEAEASVRREQEKEADQFAREAIVDSNDPENIKFEKGLSLVVAHVASLFVIRSVKALKKENYPDLDERLHTALNFLNLRNKQKRDYLWYLACVSCHKFLDIHRVSLDLPSCLGNVEECFAAYLNNLDRIK